MAVKSNRLNQLNFEFLSANVHDDFHNYVTGERVKKPLEFSLVGLDKYKSSQEAKVYQMKNMVEKSEEISSSRRSRDQIISNQQQLEESKQVD